MPTKPKLPPTILEALRAAQSALADVPKDSTNKFHGYQYTSAEEMMSSCRQALIEAGLSFSEMGTSIQGLASGLAVRTEYQLVHPESGESVVWSREFPIVPEKGRPLDKAFAGALTTSINYALRGLLLVPRVDPAEDMDHHSRTPSKSGTTSGTPRSSVAAATGPNLPNGGSFGERVHSCPACGGRVYDNRQDPDRGNRPLWSCGNRKGPDRCTGGKDGKWAWGSYDDLPAELFGDDAGPAVLEDGPPPSHFDDMARDLAPESEAFDEPFSGAGGAQ